MNDYNPYAAPETDLSAPRAPGEVGVWRDGTHLVMSKDADLPDRCLRCNAPADGWRLKRKLTWHPQGYYLLVLFNVLIYAVVAMVVRKTATVQIPLCAAHRRRRRRQIALAWVLCPLGPVVLIAGASTEMEWRSALGQDGANIVTACLMFAGVSMLIAGLVLAIIASQVVTPNRIDKRFVWLKKVSPALLSDLPPWRA